MGKLRVPGAPGKDRQGKGLPETRRHAIREWLRSVRLCAKIRSRAAGRCEYCLVPDAVTLVPHEVDHIIATKHAGETVSGNLALCCSLCNKYKGTDLASIDLEIDELQRLFHPRHDRWREHFELRGGVIVPTTGTGRVTVRLLQLNRLERIKERS